MVEWNKHEELTHGDEWKRILSVAKPKDDQESVQEEMKYKIDPNG